MRILICKVGGNRKVTAYALICQGPVVLYLYDKKAKKMMGITLETELIIERTGEDPPPDIHLKFFNVLIMFTY